MVEKLPLVSIALPFFNSESTLYAAINSIILQSYRNWELLLIDDGSTDGSLAIAKGFADERIKIVSNPSNMGLINALNKAISLSKGKYFARMDADDISYPNRLERQVRFLEENPDVDLVGSWVLVFGPGEEPVGIRATPKEHRNICARPLEGFPIVHPTYVGRINWFMMNCYQSWAIRSEDYELLYRTYKSSKFSNIQEILLGYYESHHSLKKKLLSRITHLKIIYRSYRANNETLKAALAAAIMQIAKSLTDIVVFGTGINKGHFSYRVNQDLTSEDLDFWSQLLSQVHLRLGNQDT